MLFEKPFFQKINQIADWVLRLVIINTLVIITLLPIVTLFMGLSAGYNTLYDIWKHKEKGLFKTFFMHFIDRWLYKLGLGLIMGIILLLGYINLTYYVELLKDSPTLFYQAGYYITLFFVIMMLAVSLYLLPIVYAQKTLNLKQTIKLAFYVAGKFLIRTMFILITPALLVLLFLTSFTSMIFVLFGISGWLMIMIMITEKVLDTVKELKFYD